MVIYEDGSVTGTLKYVEGFTEFSGVADEQKGNYIAIDLGNAYKGKTIKVKSSGKEGQKESQDLWWILRVANNDKTFTFSADNLPDLTLSFKGATLKQKGGS